jgi:arylformamidase
LSPSRTLGFWNTRNEGRAVQRQNRELASAVKGAGKPVTFLIGQGYNHFEMFETLGNPYGLLGRAMLEQMKLKTT